MEQNPSKIKFEVTQDKIIDLLLHAATRDDIATLAKTTREDMAKLDAKVDMLAKTTKDDIAALAKNTREDIVRLDNKIDSLTKTMQDGFIRLDNKIDMLAKTTKEDIANLDAKNYKQYRWLVGINTTIGFTVIGLMFKLISMIH